MELVQHHLEERALPQLILLCGAITKAIRHDEKTIKPNGDFINGVLHVDVQARPTSSLECDYAMVERRVECVP
jgi:hypothetical protein